MYNHFCIWVVWQRSVSCLHGEWKHPFKPFKVTDCGLVRLRSNCQNRSRTVKKKKCRPCISRTAKYQMLNEWSLQPATLCTVVMVSVNYEGPSCVLLTFLSPHSILLLCWTWVDTARDGGGHHLSVRCSGWSLCPLPPTYTPSCVCFYCESSWRRSSEGRVTNKLFFWLFDKGLFKLLAWDLCVFVWCEEEEILLSQLFLSSECQAVWRRSRPWERESDVCTQRVINDNRVRAGTRNVWLCSNYPPCGPVRAISRSLKMLRINFYWHTTAKCLVSLWQQRRADFLHLSHCENGITGSWVIVVSRHVAWHLVWGHVFCWCGSDGTLSRTRKMSIVQPFIGR